METVTMPTPENDDWLTRESHGDVWLWAALVAKESVATRLGESRDADERVMLRWELDGLHGTIATIQRDLNIDPTQDLAQWKHYVDESQ